MSSLREVCDGISRTSTGLARYCVDNDLPVIGAYCAMTQPDEVPMMGTSGVAFHLSSENVTLEDLSAFERVAPAWFVRIAEAYARREVDAGSFPLLPVAVADLEFNFIDRERRR